MTAVDKPSRPEHISGQEGKNYELEMWNAARSRPKKMETETKCQNRISNQLKCFVFNRSVFAFYFVKSANTDHIFFKWSLTGSFFYDVPEMLSDVM